MNIKQDRTGSEPNHPRDSTFPVFAIYDNRVFALKHFDCCHKKTLSIFSIQLSVLNEFIMINFNYVLYYPSCETVIQNNNCKYEKVSY
jgi:hypothetical protein